MISAELKKGIKDGVYWEYPSHIQAMAIPLIVIPHKMSGKHENLIAHSKNGSGKSGAFIVGSLLRVDPSIKKVQVIIIGHTRELVNQISSVISRILEYMPGYK
jgi:superfamily II DNA/RNA helicase